MTDRTPPRLRPTRGLQAIAVLALCLAATEAAHSTASPATAQIPAVRGTTFADVKVSLPESLHGKVGIFVVGFSQDSREAVTVWGKKLATDFYDSPTVAYYEMPVLASVPKLLRGFVQGRIKASVSDRGKPHFLPITEDESAWRTLVHYANPDAPYILVVDEHGIVRWQAEGPPTDATYATLKQQVDTLRPR